MLCHQAHSVDRKQVVQDLVCRCGHHLHERDIITWVACKPYEALMPECLRPILLLSSKAQYLSGQQFSMEGGLPSINLTSSTARARRRALQHGFI